MSGLGLSIDVSKLQVAALLAEAPFSRTLDRFVGRAAQDFVLVEKLQAPKAFTTLTNSILVRKNGIADYSAVAGTRHAKWVNDGTAPHTPPMKPLMEWLRLTKRVSGGRELFIRARGLQRYIAAHGTKANPFVQRTRDKMEGHVRQLMREGVRAGIREAYQK